MRGVWYWSQLMTMEDKAPVNKPDGSEFADRWEWWKEVYSRAEKAECDGVIVITRAGQLRKAVKRVFDELDPRFPIIWGVQVPGVDLNNTGPGRWNQVKAAFSDAGLKDAEVVLDFENDIERLLGVHQRIDESAIRAGIGDFRELPRRVFTYPIGYMANYQLASQMLTHIIADAIPQAVLCMGEHHNEARSQRMRNWMIEMYGTQRLGVMMNVSIRQQRKWDQVWPGEINHRIRGVNHAPIPFSVVYVSQYDALDTLDAMKDGAWRP